MKLADNALFLKYAVPCGSVLVARGTITQQQLDNPTPGMFKVGLFMCGQVAKRLGKKAIDKEAIRQYFWHDHDRHLAEHRRLNKDVDPALCTVYPGEYLGNGVARLPIGRRKVNISRTPKLKKGDYATVHYHHACEEITKKEFEYLWELKK